MERPVSSVEAQIKLGLDLGLTIADDDEIGPNKIRYSVSDDCYSDSDHSTKCRCIWSKFRRHVSYFQFIDTTLTPYWHGSFLNKCGFFFTVFLPTRYRHTDILLTHICFSTCRSPTRNRYLEPWFRRCYSDFGNCYSNSGGAIVIPTAATVFPSMLQYSDGPLQYFQQCYSISDDTTIFPMATTVSATAIGWECVRFRVSFKPMLLIAC